MRVDFHSGVADKVGAARAFLHKAQAAGATVVVCGDAALLDRLDAVLWTAEPLSFLPHLRVRGSAPPSPALARTPTWLVDDPDVAPARSVLLNLGPQMAARWEAFERVVEIVSIEPDDVAAGRQRWRQYSARDGIELEHHQRGGAS